MARSAHILVWQLPAGFAGEDVHRVAHRRLRPLLRERLGESTPAVVHEAGTASAVLARCEGPECPTVLVLPAFRDHIWTSIEIVRNLAATCPNLPVLLSGWGSEPDYLDAIWDQRPVAHPRFAVVRGEAEEGLVDAIAAILESVAWPLDALIAAGIAIPSPHGGWLSRGRFRQVADVGTLPSPYLTGELRPADFEGIAAVEVARGCLHHCQFCLSCNYVKKGLRPFPIERIRDEVVFAAEHGASAVGLLCSGLNYDVDQLEAISELFDGHPGARRMKIESTIHASLFDDRRLRAVRKLPWQRMIVGLQSIHPPALEIMQRTVNPEKFTRAIEAIAEFHTPTVEVILGLPGDSLQGFGATMRFVLSLPAKIEVYHLRLDPGSEFMRNRHALGIEADFSRQGRVLSTPTFPASDLERATRALQDLRHRPWTYKARGLGFDFQTIYAPRSMNGPR